ncbi:MAG TPA: SpoIID/LytB domain-containing protein [Balneolales bacterium]|nr:SpoIID/LytB domain-containing protein [Balneolales bacterium]
MDSINVLLFHEQTPDSVELWSWNGQLTVMAKSGKSIKIRPGQPAVRIYRMGRDVICESGLNRLVTNRLTIKAPPDTLIRIKAAGYPYRYYRGSVKITASGMARALHIVNKTGLEDYVGSVVGSEMDFRNIEALKVQAVIARTYALWHLSVTAGTGYDVSDNTQNQIYKGDLIMKPYCRQVALATRGEIITWSHRLILAAYSSTCGGQTASNQTVWGGKAIPYLKPVKDNGACADSPHYRWTFRISRDSLLGALHHALRGPVRDIAGLDTSQYGRITYVHLEISPEQHRTIKGTLFRKILLDQFGERSLESNWYSLQKENNMYIFHGRGMGHGVGLCQWGARGLALSGWNYRDILRFYYTGVKIEELDHIKGKYLPLAY